MMNILTVEGVAKSYGTRVLFDDVTFAVDGRQSWLIGLNGAGKTTLLKIIAGMAEADKGEIWRNPKARIHYLPQERSSILDAVFSKVSSMVICRSWMSCAAMKPLSKQTMMKPC